MNLKLQIISINNIISLLTKAKNQVSGTIVKIINIISKKRLDFNYSKTKNVFIYKIIISRL